MDAKKVLAVLGLSLGLGFPSFADPALPGRDDGDEEYRFLVGLIDKEMYELAVDEAESFLRGFPRHPKAVLARYRLATALFDLDRRADALPHYRALSQREGFEYRGEALFRRGECALELGRLDEAEEALAAMDPGGYLAAPAGFLLAETAFRAKRYDVAEGRYAAWIEAFASDPRVADARRGLAWCAWETGDAPRTVQRCRTFLRRHGSDESGNESPAELRVLLGEALLETDEPAEALEAFRAVTDGRFHDAALRGAGFARAALGDHAGAAKEFGALVERYPDGRFAAEAALQHGVELLRAGNPKRAVKALREIARGNDPETLLWLARAEDAADDPEQALKTLQRALRTEPAANLAGRIHVARGDVLSRLGRTDEARGAYERGGSDYALHAAAVSALNGGDPAGAARLAETLLEAYPKSAYRAPALLVLGEARFAEGRFDAAEEHFRAALERPDDDAQASQARSRIGWCRYLAGDPVAAAEAFAEVVRENPRGAEAEEAAYMLARASREAGDPRGANGACERYLARYPDGRWRDDVLFALGRAGEGDSGLGSFEALLEDHPDSDLAPAALLELGERLSGAGRHEEAAQRFARLVRDHPRSELVPQARYGLAWCLYEGEQYGDAVRELEVVVRAGPASDELKVAACELFVWARAKAGDPDGAAEAWRLFVKGCDDDRRRFETARAAANAFGEKGQPERALALLDELLGMLRDREVTVDVLVEGAYLALDAGDVDRAEAQVRVASKRASSSPAVAEATFFVGEARFDRGEDERAAELYERALGDGSPVVARALYKLGFARMRDGELPGAERAFGRLVEEHRECDLWGEALFLLGETRYSMDRFEPAAEAFSRLHREAPRHEVIPKTLFRLGLSLGKLERWSACEAALSELARKHADFPNTAEAELWRGRALAAQDKHRSARQVFERVIGLDKGELAAQARIGLGGIFEAQDRDEEALAEYLKVAVLYAHDESVAESLYRAGGCLERLDDPRKAAEQYREIVEKHPESSFVDRARAALQRLGGR